MMTTTLIYHIGHVGQQLGQSLGYILKRRIRMGETWAQIAALGFDSLPVVILINLIAGGVLSLQAAVRFAQTGADDYVGGLVALAVVREMSPIFTALAVAARYGTAIASEIGNMKVTDQVAALQVLHVNPIRYLFVPRILAGVISLPLLTVIGFTIAVLGGMFVANAVAHLHYFRYLDSVWLMVKPYDIWVCLFKAGVFGLLITSICCTVGLDTCGGAGEVGKSTTRAAVWAAVAIIIADFILSWAFFFGKDQSPIA